MPKARWLLDEVGLAARKVPLLRLIAAMSKPAAAELATISVQGTPPLNTGAEDREWIAAATMAARYKGIIRSKRKRTSKNG